MEVSVMNKLQQILFWIFAVALFGIGCYLNGWTFISSMFIFVAMIVISPPFICKEKSNNPNDWSKSISLITGFLCLVLGAVFSPWFFEEPQGDRLVIESTQSIIAEESTLLDKKIDSIPKKVEESSHANGSMSTIDSILDDSSDINYPVLRNPKVDEYNSPKFSDYAAEKGDSITFKDTEASEKKVHVTATGEKYHRANCQYLRQSDYEITLKEAKRRGLSPCSVCNP